jgi:hypothetical protein
VVAYSNGDLSFRPLDVSCHLDIWTVRTGTDRIEFEMRELGASEADPPSRRIYLLPHGGLFDERQTK